ncbi:hypothetical protein EVAR_3038_1 [Eumeta japonica]|uniref:Uncharacterized protein n=1 Tax=Eumeta variegata TaxID=151549 RepID=A0A4C1SWY5_EUMVA|nr:hypothetical protein EVAR_3038_1 [Eumeta japonica]
MTNDKRVRDITVRSGGSQTIKLITYSSDFGAARLDSCKLRRVVRKYKEVPNAETLSRHESSDCKAKRGITHAHRKKQEDSRVRIGNEIEDSTVIKIEDSTVIKIESKIRIRIKSTTRIRDKYNTGSESRAGKFRSNCTI